MYYLKRSTFDRNYQKAKEYLVSKGILALDGSGEPSVEELFAHLRLLADGRLLLTDTLGLTYEEDEEDDDDER